MIDKDLDIIADYLFSALHDDRPKPSEEMHKELREAFQGLNDRLVRIERFQSAFSTMALISDED